MKSVCIAHEYVTLDGRTGMLQSPERTIHVDEKHYFYAVFRGDKVAPAEVCVSDHVRCCTECKEYVSQYYLIGDGDYYFCSDECLHEYYTQDEYYEMYEEDEACWVSHD